MCIAIYSPADSRTLTVAEFNVSLRNNPDGMGLLYAENGEFKIIKTLTRGDLVWKEYLRAHNRGLNVLLHFRIKTYGEKTVENCHPFMHGEDLAYIHNGTLTLDKVPAGEVDSRIFSERILQHLPENWWEFPDILAMVERFTTGSKFCFMNRSGEVLILHKNSGNTQDGIWFSNYGWRERKETVKIGFDYGYSNFHGWGEEWQKDSKKDTKKKKDKWESKYGYGQRSSYTAKESAKVFQDDFSDLENEDYPSGFSYFGYFLCSYCATCPEYSVKEDRAMIPVFRYTDYDDETNLPKTCTVCDITITDGSPVAKHWGLWNKITGCPVDEKADQQSDFFTNVNDRLNELYGFESNDD